MKAIDRFLADQRYAEKDEIADARNLLGRAYQLQKKFDKALEAWRNYLAKHPSHSAWSDVQRGDHRHRVSDRLREAAGQAVRRGRQAWTEFLVKYPLDARNPGDLVPARPDEFRAGKIRRGDRRLAAAGQQVSRHERIVAGPVHDRRHARRQARQAGRGACRIQKGDLGQFRIARPAVAIGRLTAKTMSIATDRVFRSNETPKIKLTSRNIDTVTVKAFKVDLETYFRKMHNTHGVEGLDISLIDPDQTIEFKVPKYAEYQQLESEIEIPLPKNAEGKVADRRAYWP